MSFVRQVWLSVSALIISPVNTRCLFCNKIFWSNKTKVALNPYDNAISHPFIALVDESCITEDENEVKMRDASASKERPKIDAYDFDD